MRFTLKIKPSIDIEVRQQIEKVLNNSGIYQCTGAGTDLVDDEMDISFEEIDYEVL